MVIYLYVKTHNQTGMKYLGKTQSKDPHRYSGSGVYWKLHLKKHGNDYRTEILKECSSNEEIKYWGSHYSLLWNIVESDAWANLKIEYGDGNDPESARKINKEKVKNGTHHWLNGEHSRKYQLERVREGKHHFLGSEIAKTSARKRVRDGTLNFLGGEIQRNRVKNGSHPFLGGKIQRESNLNRAINGTHPSQILKNCEHCMKEVNLIAYGKSHGKKCSIISKKEIITCPFCGKTSTNPALMKRWHYDNCKLNIK